MLSLVRDDYDYFSTQAQFIILCSNDRQTVCYDGWDWSDANVVCKQLCYSGPRSATNRSDYGKGCGNKWMINHIVCD